VTPQQLTLIETPPHLVHNPGGTVSDVRCTGGHVWDWARLVLQRDLTPEQMARVLAEARRSQCSRVEAYERLKEEGRL
jgi:hypothetical protein